MKYLLIPRKFGIMKRGAYTTSIRMKSLYPDYIDVKDIESINEVNDIRNNYTRLIFLSHSFILYKNKYNITKINQNDIIFSRNDNLQRYRMISNMSANNGFSHYLSEEYKFFIPTIFSFNLSCKYINHIDPIIGIYIRPGEANLLFAKLIDFIKNLSFKIHIVVMGKFINLSYMKNVISCYHTYDSVEFFNKITHFLYFKLDTFQDPFPHTLVEAVDCRKQIIIPPCIRNFKDGADDIQTCIKYHHCLNINEFDNSNTILHGDNFISFYDRLLENNFEYILDRKKYKDKCFREWCENEL